MLPGTWRHPGTRSRVSTVVLTLVLIAVPASGQSAADDAAAFKAAYSAYETASAGGDFVGAAREAGEAARLARRLFGKNHPNTASMTLNHGNALLAAGDRRALNVLEKAVKQYKKVYGGVAPEVIDAAMALGKAHAQFGRAADAELQFETAADIAAQHGLMEGRLAPRLYYDGGMALASKNSLDQSKGKAATSLLTKARDVYRTSLDAGHPRAGEASYQIAMLAIAAGRYEDAETHLKDALVAFLDKPNFIRQYQGTLGWLVHINERLGRPETASDYLLRYAKTVDFDPDADQAPVHVTPIPFPPGLPDEVTKGSALIEFSIDPKGRPLDPEVVETSGGDVFGRTALEAIVEWRFAPKLADDKPVTSERVRHRVVIEVPRDEFGNRIVCGRERTTRSRVGRIVCAAQGADIPEDEIERAQSQMDRIRTTPSQGGG